MNISNKANNHINNNSFELYGVRVALEEGGYLTCQRAVPNKKTQDVIQRTFGEEAAIKFVDLFAKLDKFIVDTVDNCIANELAEIFEEASPGEVAPLE